MGYTRTTWATSDVITAAKLNNIETHLQDVADAIVRATRTSSDQTLTASTDSKLIWNTEDYDTDGLYDNTTGRFTAAAEGVYLFSVSCVVAPGVFNSTNAQTLKAFLNGSAAAVLSDRWEFRSGEPVTGVYMLRLSAADYVEFYMNTANISPTMDANTASFISVARIS